MSEEVLSENEVDALMESSGDDEVFFADDSAREYRRFDITAREQGTVNRMGALTSILERQDELLHHGLGKQFNTDMAVKCQAPRVFTVSEAIAPLPEGLVLVTLNLRPVAGESFLVISLNTPSYLVHRYFGGGNTKPPSVTGRTDTTSSEMRVASARRAASAIHYRGLQGESNFRDRGDRHAEQSRRAGRASGHREVFGAGHGCDDPDFEDALRLFVPFESFESLEDTLAGPSKNQASRWRRVAGPNRRANAGCRHRGIRCVGVDRVTTSRSARLKVGDVVDLAQLGSVSLEVQNQSSVLASSAFLTTKISQVRHDGSP